MKLNFGFYFGYGSFSSHQELKRFIPKSLSLGKFKLRGYKSGYCVVSKNGKTATYGIEKNDQSFCKGRLYILFNFNKLDAIEGKDRYERKLVFLGIIPVYTYIPKMLDWNINLEPSPKYKAIIEKEILELS